jgi:hypothetical protein
MNDGIVGRAGDPQKGVVKIRFLTVRIMLEATVPSTFFGSFLTSVPLIDDITPSQAQARCPADSHLSIFFYERVFD